MKWIWWFLKFKIIRWDPPFLGRTKTEEMNSPGSRVVSIITAFSSKLEISAVIITCSLPTKTFSWWRMSLRRLGTEFNILAWYHLIRISVSEVVCCQAGINCASLLLLKQLVCATRYAINVGTKRTKSFTCIEFTFEVIIKSSFIFLLGSSFFFQRFCFHLGWYWPLPEKGLSCFWRQEGLEEELEPLLWLTAVWLIWFKAWIAVRWAWSSSPNNKVLTGVWEEHREQYYSHKLGLMASRWNNESS